MNINQFCVKITVLEGKKKQVNIAQIKEILKCIKNLLKKYVGIDIYEVIRKVDKK